MRPGQDARITHLFKRGYSLDLVSEFGLLYGWTRQEAKTVLAARGWTLDWTGRLHPRYMRAPIAAPGPSVAAAGPEMVLNAGIDHENPDVRKCAQVAERAIERLRTALMRHEAADAERVEAERLSSAVLSEALGVVLGTQIPGQRERTS